jgi:hypothetical protein
MPTVIVNPAETAQQLAVAQQRIAELEELVNMLFRMHDRLEGRVAEIAREAADG